MKKTIWIGEKNINKYYQLYDFGINSSGIDIIDNVRLETYFWDNECFVRNEKGEIYTSSSKELLIEFLNNNFPRVRINRDCWKVDNNVIIDQNKFWHDEVKEEYYQLYRTFHGIIVLKNNLKEILFQEMYENVENFIVNYENKIHTFSNEQKAIIFLNKKFKKEEISINFILKNIDNIVE